MKADQARVDAAAAALSEHFDSVIIIVTRYDGGEDAGTYAYSKGAGNWHARVGSVKEWLARVEAHMVEPDPS